MIERSYLVVIASCFVLVYFTFSNPLASLETKSLYSDNIYVQTDKDVYKHSEIIWFKAYILETSTNKISFLNKTLFVQLKEKATNKTAFETRFEIVNGSSSGDIFIKKTFNPGLYYLQCYTANSINAQQKDFVSFKAIEIKNSDRKIYYESIFDKAVYDVHTPLNVQLTFYDNNGEEFFNESIKCSYYNKSGKLIKTKKFETDENGQINYTIEPEFNTPDMSVKFVPKNLPYQELILNIPYKKANDLKVRLFPEGGKARYNLPNKIAFKAFLANGEPQQIKAQLLEDNRVLFEFNSFHDGMGFFHIEPKMHKTYRVKVITPKVTYVDIPISKEPGLNMSLIKNTKDELKILIAKSEDSPIPFANISIAHNGNVFWSSKVALAKKLSFIKIPKSNIPNGTLELILSDHKNKPIAERLFYASVEKSLQIESLNSVETNLDNKEKIQLKFRVSNPSGERSFTNLGLRVYDNALYNPLYATNIEAYYTLFSNLRGKIHDPLYYFNSNNKNRINHLDLLLLTHGWRNYRYLSNESNRSKTFGPLNKIEDTYKLQVFEINENGKLGSLSKPVQMQLTYPQGIFDKTVYEDGILEVPLAENQMVLIKAPRKGKYFFEHRNQFRLIDNLLSKYRTDLPTKFHKQKSTFSQNDLKLYFNNNSTFLDEVVIKTTKDRYANVSMFGRKWVYPWEGDYVCEQFDVFNCVNHVMGGYKPVHGKAYKKNDGSTIIYREKKAHVPSTTYKKKNDFQYVKGFQYKKEFYSPDYAFESQTVLDNRTTLAWFPNLVVDKHGIVTCSFYTSDVNSSFTIHIEGVDVNGNMASEYMSFKVRPSF